MHIHRHTHREQNTITVLTYGTEFYVNYRILEPGMAMKIILDDTFFIDDVNIIKVCYLPRLQHCLKVELVMHFLILNSLLFFLYSEFHSFILFVSLIY